MSINRNANAGGGGGNDEADANAAAAAAPRGGSVPFQVGLCRKLTENSCVCGVYRSNGPASLRYKTKFPDSKVDAQVGANFTFGQNPLAANMVYKVVFG